MPLNFITYISISKGFTSGQIYPFPHDNFWLSHCVIELDSLSKKNNPHARLIWGGITFQVSICHIFPLKLDCAKFTPTPHLANVLKS